MRKRLAAISHRHPAAMRRMNVVDAVNRWAVTVQSQAIEAAQFGLSFEESRALAYTPANIANITKRAMQLEAANTDQRAACQALYRLALDCSQLMRAAALGWRPGFAVVESGLDGDELAVIRNVMMWPEYQPEEDDEIPF